MLPTAAADYYQQQQRFAALAAGSSKILWRQMSDDFDTAWARIASQVQKITTAAQLAAARTSGSYISSVIYETGQVDLPAADVRPETFAGVASDGRDLDTLLYGAVTTSKASVAKGLSPSEALAVGGRWLTMTTLTAVADAGRAASSTAIAMRPAIGGWVRMLNPPSCSRCAVLAGKWYRWNEGFLRHPHCDCRHIPASENVASNYTTDPYEYFKSLSKEEQEATFGRIESRAIRDGADIYRIENVKLRGLATPKGALKFGTPSRMTIDDIYRSAGTRTNAIRLMEREGFITGPQNATGNILGQREGFGALGRGGTRVGASRAVREARATGVRDSLERATMTEAERRLYDAHTMMQTVERGANPWLKGQRLTDGDRALAVQIYNKQVGDLVNQPAQVNELARRLGIL